MNTLTISSQTLTPTSVQLIRNQLQNALTTLTETLSAVRITAGASSTQSIETISNKEVREALIDIIENQEKYITDDLIKPLLNESNTNVPSSSFYENRYGFSYDELLNSQYKENRLTQREQNLLFGKKLNLFRNTIRSSLHTSSRGFKTQRSHDKELEKAGFLKRLVMHKDTKPDSLDKIAMKNQRLIDIIENKHEQPKPFAQPLGSIAPSATTTASATNPTGTTDESKIKLAFAEGYLANESLSRRKHQEKLRILRLLFWFGITLFMLYSFGLIGGKPFDKSFDSSSSNQSNSGVKFRFSLGLHNFQIARPEDISTRFSDVKGVDEAKEELQEVVDYLKDPEKYTRLGGRLPKGVLLVGPPGTGKTLLARAVAGEAAVTFFQTSGSEFDEMFVGTGAKKVRQLFSTAKQHAPCVVFIDEIDSVGSKRTSSQLHPYANQTINQLLSEMDGFEKNSGIIILAATNRREMLDKALVRPGRFDIEVKVDRPDLKGRIEIVNFYLSKIVHSADVDPESIAKRIVGFTGADIENLINQSALRAAMENENEVSMKHIDWSRDRIVMGAQKASKIMDDETNRNTAYHEAGHTIVAYFTKESDPPHKVTIIPRGHALGVTYMIPEKDFYGFTKSQLMAKLDVALGGRIAEELTFGADKITTGASSDFQNATNIATQMIKNYGMSDKVGVRIYDDETRVSPQTQELVDQEIKRYLDESYHRATNILRAHSSELKALAEALLEYETLDETQIKTILEGKKLQKPKPSNDQQSTKKLQFNDDKNKINKGKALV